MLLLFTNNVKLKRFFFSFYFITSVKSVKQLLAWKEQNTQKKKKLVLSENNNIFTIWLRLRNSCVDISVLFGF